MAMAALGLFVFELRTTPFQGMQREHQFRFGYHNRIGKRPSYQFWGHRMIRLLCQVRYTLN